MKKIKLFLAAIAAMVGLSAQAQSWTSPGSDPVSGSTYYLYNVGAARFVTAANSWGTQMSITGTDDGLLIRTNEVSNVSVGGTAISGWELLNTNNSNKFLFRDDQWWGYTDYNNQNRGYVWNFTKVNGVYHLQTAAADPAYTGAALQYAGGNTALSDGRVYFGYNENSSDIDWLFLTADQKNATNLAAKAKLYRALMKAHAAGANTDEAAAVYENSESTESELLAQVTALDAARYQAHLANASDSDPRDITEFVLKNSDFTQMNINDWETNYVSGTQATNIGYQDNNNYQNASAFCNRFIEAWRSGNAAIGDGYLRQTVSGMPEGKYMLECDAIAVNQGNASATTTGALLFITADGSDYTASLSTGNAAPQHFSTQFLFTGEGDIIFGLKTVNATCNWIAADNFKVTFYGIDLSAYVTQLANEVAIFDRQKGSLDDDVKDALQTQVDALNTTYASSKTYAAAIANMQTINAYATAYIAATSARDNSANDNVIGTESVALTSAIADAPTYADYTTYAAKTTALENATSAYTAAAPNYDALVREITKAKALGIAAATADGYAATAESTAATALTNTQALMVVEYNFVNNNYQYAVDIDPKNWTASGDYGTMTSQHWSGNSSTVYYEQSGSGYSNGNWSLGYTTTVALPAGNYMFKVAGRKASDNVTMTLTVKNGETTLGTVSDFPNHDYGLGINKNGATSFDAEDEAGFANNNNGRGWQWRYVQFTLADPASVTLTVTGSATPLYQWLGFCDASLLTDNQDNVDLMEALVSLTEAVAAATLTQHTNVGTGVFQLVEATDNSLWSAYTTAKTNAENFTLTSSSTTDDVTVLTTALTTAQTNYNNNQVINPADASKRYTLTIVENGKDWNGNAVTFIAGGRTDQGLYAIKYLTPANANMNQALKFTAVEGETNTYKVSAINTEGDEQYITTGKTYSESGTNEQIRTTNDAEKASSVKIIATTDKSGEFQLYNVSASKVIANNNNNDMYTANSANFTLAEAGQASVAINTTAAGWGTTMLPFAVAALPSGVKAYTCAAVDGNTLTLAEVDALAANTPYIIEGAWNETLTGDAQGAALQYTPEGSLLTGVYADYTTVGGEYVMQKQGDVVGFYQVGTEDGDAKPVVRANRAYLTVPAGGGVKAFYLGGGEDAIKSVFEGVAAGEVYDLSGRKVSKLQRGVNIVNGKKVIVK